jgi:hypothetical protein
VSGNVQRRFQFTISHHLEPVSQPLDHTPLEKKSRSNFLFWPESREIAEVNQRIALLKDIREPTLRNAALQGHLPALKTRAGPRTRPRPLSFGTARGGLAVS